MFLHLSVYLVEYLHSNIVKKSRAIFILFVHQTDTNFIISWIAPMYSIGKEGTVKKDDKGKNVTTS